MSASDLILIFYALCLVIMAVLFWTAPEGHETPEHGFRFGPEPFNHGVDRLADRDGIASPVSAPFHDSLNSGEGEHNHAR